MKRYVKYLCFFLMLPLCLQADEWFFEIKPGYFYPTDSVMRHIFNKGGFSIRAEIDYQFKGPAAAWLDGGYYSQSGHAIGGPELVDIQVASGTLGLKLIGYLNQSVGLYGGVGARVFSMHIVNHSIFVKRANNKVGVGPAYIAGVLIFPRKTKHLYLDLFVDYATKTIHTSSNGKSSFTYSTKLDGITAGFGLGYRL